MRAVAADFDNRAAEEEATFPIEEAAVEEGILVQSEGAAALTVAAFAMTHDSEEEEERLLVVHNPTEATMRPTNWGREM